MFFNNLEILCKKHNLKITNLISMLGLSKSGISRWRAGNIPNGETLIKIADYFNCSIDYLLGRSEESESTPAPFTVFSTTPEERENARLQEWIMGFNQLNDEAQNTVLNYLEYIVSQPKNLKIEDNSTQMNA